MKNIIEIGGKLGLTNEDLELYGNDKAKIIKKISPKIDSKLILVTAINPTPYGEGKTTVSIGLNDALCSLEKKSIVCLREPSLGPVFGMKGGATGGGRASIIPEDEINLHFTGDFHAITAANNLLASAIDNHIYQGNELGIDENTICFKRCLDVNDRSLKDKFNITAASEVMAVFCLANDFSDLKRRLGNILVAYNKCGNPIYTKDLKVDGAMAMLLKKAFYPNLVQTLEENPCIVHGGPFANIAHGCCSITSLKIGLGLSDYVITEAGFGSDLGAEKFMNVLCRKSNLIPSYVVLVATVRALEHSGIENLDAHIDHLKQYNIPFCVTVNKFSEDNDDEIQKIVDYCSNRGIKCFITDSYNSGGAGSINLAKDILDTTRKTKSLLTLPFLYDDSLTIKEKIYTLANKVYHATNVEFSEEAINALNKIEQLGFNQFPICIAKTQYSISDNKDLLGYPKNYTLHVRDIVIQSGSEMIVVLLNKIITMPGLPKHPNFENLK